MICTSARRLSSCCILCISCLAAFSCNPIQSLSPYNTRIGGCPWECRYGKESQDYIAIVSSIVINVTGGFKDENNPVNSNVAYVVHLDDNKKAAKLDICWDNNDPALRQHSARSSRDLMLLPRYLRVLCPAYPPRK